MHVSQLRLGLLRRLCGLEDEAEVVAGVVEIIWSGCWTPSSAFSALASSALLAGALLAGLLSKAASRGVSLSMAPHIKWKLWCNILGGKVGII